MVQRAGLGREDVGIGVGADKERLQVGVTTCLQRGHRVFLGVGVQVAHDHEVRIARACGIAQRPVDQRIGCGGAGQVPAALAVALVGVQSAGAGAAFGLEMVDDDREAAVGGDLLEGLGQRGPVQAGIEVRIDQAVKDGEVAHRLHHARLVDDTNLDHVARVDGAGIDVVVGSWASQRVQTIDQVSQRLDVRRVLQLHQAYDVGVQNVERLQELVALAGELQGRIGAAALHVLVGAAGEGRCVGRVQGQEIVEYVGGANPERSASAHRVRRRGPRVACGEGRHRERVDAVDVAWGGPARVALGEHASNRAH